MKNKEKSKQLGINFGTASSRLKKNLMFKLIQKCGEDVCFVCGNKIEFVDDMSVEHKKPWLHEVNAKELFFDLNNIAFSHTKCNISNIRRQQKVRAKSGYKNVYTTDNSQKPFKATVSLNGKEVMLGKFTTAEEASEVAKSFLNAGVPER